MDILARYVHGSPDSRDLDVVYIVDEMPPLGECPAFCSADPMENRNLAVIRDGVIVECFKGFPDEVNNALRATYALHEQHDPLLIRRSVDRDLPVKCLSVLRKLLMELRHTSFRPAARAALKGNYTERLALARKADLRRLEWQIPQEEQTERRKAMAFQIGQALALRAGTELYTKQAISDYMPALRPYLCRQTCPMDALEAAKSEFIDALTDMGIEDCGNRTVRIGDRRVWLPGKEHTIEVGEWN